MLDKPKCASLTFPQNKINRKFDRKTMIYPVVAPSHKALGDPLTNSYKTDSAKYDYIRKSFSKTQQPFIFLP